MRCPGQVTVLASLLVLSLLWFPVPAVPQLLGDEAEMTRLRVKAEEAVADDDPDGAAMAMGRAALMAAQLAKKQAGLHAQMYKAHEALFRSQEHTYRAMALFRRAGSQLPASSGVCGSLALAQGSLRQAVELTAAPQPSPSPDRLIEDVARLRETADTWSTVIDSMIADYQCP